MYDFDVCCDATKFEVITAQLRSLRSRQKRPNMLQDPTWLKLQYSIRDDAEVAIAIARVNGKVVCAAPLIKETTDRYSWQLRLPGHDFTLARFHLRQAEFLGDSILDPNEDVDIQEKFFRSILEYCQDCDIIAFRTVAIDSILHRLLSGQLPSFFRWRWRPREASTRWLVRITGSFDDFFAREFSQHRRHELRREARRLESACEQGLEFSVFSSPDDVVNYFDIVNKIIVTSWQGQRLGHQIDQDKLIRSSQWLAENSSFRGYLLSNGDEPLAFVYGRLADGVFFPEKSGYVSSWAKFSPGKHIWYRLIEDLYSIGSVRWMDFGMYDLWYKEFWSNDSYREDGIFLLRPSTKTLFALGPSIVMRAPLRVIGNFLNRFGMQAKYRRFLYRLSRGSVRPRTKQRSNVK